jgi:hypothetical protein
MNLANEQDAPYEVPYCIKINLFPPVLCREIQVAQNDSANRDSKPDLRWPKAPRSATS